MQCKTIQKEGIRKQYIMQTRFNFEWNTIRFTITIDLIQKDRYRRQLITRCTLPFNRYIHLEIQQTEVHVCVFIYLPWQTYLLVSTIFNTSQIFQSNIRKVKEKSTRKNQPSTNKFRIFSLCYNNWKQHTMQNF